MLALSMGMTQSYPAASLTTDGTLTHCSSCINNNISSDEDAVGGQQLCVEYNTSSEERERNCSITTTNNDSDIQDGDCDVMLQSCEEVFTDEPSDVACVCLRETRSFTHTGSLPKRWKDSVNNRTKAWGRSGTPPCRMTSDGTIVNYWCDLPRKSVTGSHGMFAVSYLCMAVHWLSLLCLGK
jgi:hypothetical protein